MGSYVYTNWREKSFVIDQTFVDNIKRLGLADGDDSSELDFLTPELLFEWLPTIESIRRHEQLEDMWHQLNAIQDK